MTALSEVFVVEGSCGDYYCEGSHVVGIYTTDEEAQRARTAALAATHSYARHDEPRPTFRTWQDAEVVKVTVGVQPTPFEMRGVAA